MPKMERWPRYLKRPPDWALEVGVGTVVGIVYLLTLSGNHSETEDSVNFAVRVRDDPHSTFWEGFHLVYDWIGWTVYESVRATGITHDPLRTLQVFDVLLAATTVALLARILLRAGLPLPVALVACGIAAFSYGFWRDSVDVEVYALSALGLVATLGAGLHAVERPSTRSFALLGLLNGLAVLAHASAIVFGAVAVGALWLARAKRRHNSPVRWFAAYLASASGVVVLAYAAAATALRLHSPTAFWSWLTAENRGGRHIVGMAALKDAVIGCSRALVGAHSALAVPGIATFVHRQFPSKPLREETYFLRGFSQSIALALLGLSAVVALLVLACAALWLSRRAWAASSDRVKPLAVLCGTWLVTFGLLYVVWDPLNIELWYGFWLPAAVLLALPLAFGSPRRLRIALGGVLVVALLVVNLFGSMLPQHSNSKDYWRVRAGWYRAHVRPNDLVISYDYIWSTYLAYLTPGHVVDAQALFKSMPRSAAAERVRRIADSSHARHVYISDYAFHPYPNDPGACNDGLGTCANAAILRRLLLSRSHAVATTVLERVWEYGRPGVKQGPARHRSAGLARTLCLPSTRAPRRTWRLRSPGGEPRPVEWRVSGSGRRCGRVSGRMGTARS